MELIPKVYAIVPWIWEETNNIINNTSQTSFWDSISYWLWILPWIILWLIIWYVIFTLLKRLIRLLFEVLTAWKLVRIKVTLPRADSKLDKEQETRKDFKEEIWVMSIYFKAAHKMSEASFHDTFFNFIFRHVKASYEIIYEKWRIHFYIVTYRSFLPLISQLVTANYPSAETLVVDYKDFPDIKPKWYAIKTASVWKEKEAFFPIRTFRYFEDDPLSTIVNSFWSLNKDDVAVLQIVTKPEWDWFTNKAKKVAWLVAKWEYTAQKKWFIFFRPLKIILSPISLIFNLITTWNSSWSSDSTHPGASWWDAYKIFNQAEQEAQKMIWENAWQQNFKASIRILVSSKNSKTAREWLHNLVSTMSIFTDEYNNKLDNPQVIEDLFWFIITPIRYFAYRYRLLWFFQDVSQYAVDELSTLYHFPDIVYNRTPIIDWLEYKKLPPPANMVIPNEQTLFDDYERDEHWNVKTVDWSYLKVDKHLIFMRAKDRSLVLTDWNIVPIHKAWDLRWKPIDEWKWPIKIKKQRKLLWFNVFKDWLLLWWNEYRNKKTPIYFSKKDRWRHQYIIWKSWGWKSAYIWYLARQDLWNWEWLWVIDPHGDLIEDIIAFTPKERARDMIIFDPGDTQYPMWLNMLEVISDDPEVRAMEKDRAALDATSIFIKIFDEEIFGPRIQHYFRNGALTLMDDEEDGWTLIDVPRLFTDEVFLKYKRSKIQNPVVKSFWDHEYDSTWDREKQEMIPYFSSKFWPFVTNTTIRNIIWQPKSAFNIREAMDSKKCLMINLSKWKIWDLNAQLLWLIMVSKINMAAMSRADMPEEDRKDFFLYVDEFQNFATDTFWEILSEARKYKLALIMAHQFIAQIWWQSKDGKPTIKDAVFWNAGTIQSFKIGADDAEYMEKEYSPLLSQQDIIWIANYTAYTKLNINNATSRPFDLKTIWDMTYKSSDVSHIIKEYSRRMYGRKKKFVDQEIELRLWITPISEEENSDWPDWPEWLE